MESKMENGCKRLKQLSQIKADPAVQAGSYALYPGARCPLALITNVLVGIEGACALVVGMAECTYYNKNISMAQHNEYQNNLTWSYALDPKEVIFGCRKGVLEALERIDQEGSQAIFLVSACVPETTGEDFDGIAKEANEKCRARILHIRAAHFTCYSGIPSMEDTLLSLRDLMEFPSKKQRKVNLIGCGAGRLAKSELVRVLEEEGVEVHQILPDGVSISDIQNAPEGALSVVTDPGALLLAKKMYEDFSVPYVAFPHLLDIREIEEAYQRIGAYLNISLEQRIRPLYIKAEQKMEEAKVLLQGSRFGCGYSDIDSFLCAAFLGSLGMEPVYIETEYYYPEAARWREQILALSHDPYVGRVWDEATTKRVLASCPMDFFIGYKMKRQKIDIPRFVQCGTAGSALGFEQTILLLDTLLESSTDRERKEED